MLARFRIAMLILAVGLLPIQAIANVLMPLCADRGAATQDHAAHGHDHAAAGQEHGQHDHPQPADTHHANLGGCGVCHLTAGLSFEVFLPDGVLVGAERYGALPPRRVASHIPEQPQRPPLA